MAEKERTLISFDWALKSILRRKDNFDILEGFLSDLLNDNITIDSLLESESNKDSENDKFNRVDLKAKDGAGREIIIEVQYERETDYLERVYYGVSKSLVDDMKEGYKYGQIKKVISVSIVYWKLLEKSYIVKGSMKFEDMADGNKEISVNESKAIFADYYFIQPEWFNDKIKTKLDEWVYLFKHSKVKGDIEATNMSKAQEKLDRLHMTEKELRIYEEYQFNKAINESIMATAINDGIEKGRQEMIEAMRKNGLSEEDINHIVNSINKKI